MFSLNVDQFRGFVDQSFEFSKVNILIGENSGGKSSLIKLLLLLKQSMSISGNEEKLWIDGPMVDLGQFSDFIANRDLSKTIKISYKTTNSFKDFYLKFLSPSENENAILEFIKVKTEELKEFLGECVTTSFYFSADTNTNFSTHPIHFHCNAIGSIDLIVLPPQDGDYGGVKKLTGNLIYKGIDGSALEMPVEVSKDGFMTLVEGKSIREFIEKSTISDNLIFEKIAYMLLSQNEFDTVLRSISYLNPINYRAERFYLKREPTNKQSASDYRSTISGLTAIYDNEDARNDFLNAVKEMGLAQDIVIGRNDNSPVIEIRVNVGGLISNIVDVGYGVSLQIPILMHTIYMKYQKRQSRIVIEQPEIHLHPALQAKFIQTLLKFGGSSSFIIETHSEHILRKLQVLVKNTTLKSSDVSIFYFKNVDGAFKITKHSISDNGMITPSFPKGFYDTAFDLSMELI